MGIMKRYEKIFEEHMSFSSVRPLNSISETEKHFLYQAMKESAWQAWKCFGRDKIWFERWWEEEPQTNKRPEDWHE
jgi:hypothetical protein